jgi:signal transduction histidine kinase
LRETAQDIIAEADRMETWVRALLDYSRPLSGRPETVELNAIIKTSLEDFKRKMDKCGITVSTQLGVTLPYVQGHSSTFGQVFNSLLANALDAMPGRGQLMVTSRLAADRRHVEVRISDSGKGIEAGDLGKVLKPFYTTKPKGMGVGLPLAKRIIERHGGTLAIASSAGVGTTVTLEFVAV